MPHQIPKRIIQTAKTAKLSLHERASSANLKLLNPEFEYLFFDDFQVEQFVQAKFPQYVEVFKGFRFPIQRFDFFRYLAVYHFGGFYFDLDVLLAEGLSHLLGSSCVFPFEGLTFSHFLRHQLKMDWLIGNYGFGAVPRHPFIAAIIDNCVKAQENPKWVEPMMRGSAVLMKDEYFVLNSTGPGLISRTLAEDPVVASLVTVLFPDDVCDVSKWNRFGELGVHLMNASWRPATSFVRKKVSQYIELVRMQTVLKHGRKLGTRRMVPPPRSL